jgi:tetratricopeptide (TPR) repeat protein
MGQQTREAPLSLRSKFPWARWIASYLFSVWGKQIPKAFAVAASQRQRRVLHQPGGESRVKLMRTILALALLLTAPMLEAVMPVSPEGRMLMQFEQDLSTVNTALEKTPDSVQLYSRRGDLYLFLGRYREAVSAFEKMIALDPAQDSPHWRLGIAY